MQDLDDVMNKFKNKSSISPGQQMIDVPQPTPVGHYSLPLSSQSGPLTSTISSPYMIGQNESRMPITSQPEVLHSAVSTISSIETNRSQRDTPREHEISGNSNSDAMLRNVVDSGAYSLGQSTDKDQDGSDTQRSCSDKMDTFRLGTTPRDFIGQAESDSGYNFGSTPRDGPNDSNNSIFQLGSTPREDELQAMTGYNVVLSHSDTASLGFTPRDTTFTPRDYVVSNNGGTASFMLENLPQTQNGSNKNLNFSNGNLEHKLSNTRTNGERKEMSIIQEFTETDHTESEGETDQFYHKYRDALTEEDESENLEEGDIVVPRTLNSVSGIFRCSLSNNSEEAFLDNLGNQLEHENNHKPQTTNGITQKTVQNHFCVNDFEEFNSETNAQNKQYCDLEQHFSSQKQDHFFVDQHNRNNFVNGDTHGDPKNPSKTLLSNVELDLNSELNTQTINSHFSNHDDRNGKHLLSNVEFDSVTSGSAAFQRSDSESGSRVSSAGSRQNRVRTFSEQSAESLGIVDEFQSKKTDIIEDLQPHINSDSEHSKAKVSYPTSDSNVEVRNVNGGLPVENGWGYSESDGEELSQKPKVDRYPKSKPLPNFFLPVKHLEESMRALKIATSALTQPSEQVSWGLCVMFLSRLHFHYTLCVYRG